MGSRATAKGQLQQDGGGADANYKQYKKRQKHWPESASGGQKEDILFRGVRRKKNQMEEMVDLKKGGGKWRRTGPAKWNNIPLGKISC